MSKAAEHLTQQELESYLWGAANAAARPHRRRRLQAVHLPAALLQAPVATSGTRSTSRRFDETGDAGYARATANDRFPIPDGAHWTDVRSASRDVGRALLNAFRAIEAANPKRLSGVFGNAPWTNKAQLPDETLKNLIEHFSQHDAEPGDRARGRARQRLRVPDQAVRRRQRPHGAGVLHQPHARPPDDADARAAARRAHLRPDLRHRRHAHLVRSPR